MPTTPTYTPHRPAPFTVSMVRNTAPQGKLCKELEYDPDNRGVKSRASAHLTTGSVTTLSFTSIGEFMTRRNGLAENEALMMGLPIYPDSKVVTQAELRRIPSERRANERIIARDRAHVSWADGPSVVMLDLDRPDAFPAEIQPLVPTTPEGWRELLIEVSPGLLDVPMAWAPSSSSHIYLADEELHGLRGQRFYFIIESGILIPRFADALHDALVRRGAVWFQVSKSGQRLKRLPFDLAVYRPEHLDFAAAPHCKPPLEWRPQEPLIWNDSGTYLCASGIPATSQADLRRIEATLREKRQAKTAEANAVRERWTEETGRTIALRNGKDQAEGSRIARAAVKLRVLLPDFVLTDSDGNTVTVGELLEDPQTHHGRRFRDPLDPDYRDDPRIAVFLLDDQGRCRIYSHAHGGGSWRCERKIPIVHLGLINETVDEIRGALEQDGCDLYRSGNALVSVNQADASIETLDVDGLGLRLQRRLNVVSRNRNGHWVPKNIPVRDLRALLSEASDLPLPQLRDVVRGPYALADGTAIDRPGYHPESQVIYAATSPYPPMVRQTPSVADAREAFHRLWHPVSKFPYETDIDRGVVLAAMLSAVARPSLPIAPGYLFTAHVAGTGKTLLAQTIGSLQTGLPIAAGPLPRDDEEIRKHVFASVRQGLTYLLYDNAERGSEIDSAVLANLITAPLVEGRVLGISSVERRPNQLTLALTGNNVSLRGDLNRRILTVHLDAGVEHPWQREFPFHPVAYVLAHWLELRIAALELIRAWVNAGAPLVDGATGFPEWDAMVRPVVTWIGGIDTGIGLADPGASFVEAYSEDPETDDLRRLLETWHAVFGDREIQLRDIEELEERVQAASCDFSLENSSATGVTDAEQGFAEARRAVIGPWSRNGDERQQFGQYLSKSAGRVVGGLRLNKGGRSGGARRWSVTHVELKPTVDGIERGSGEVDG